MLEECIVSKVDKRTAYVGLSPSSNCSGCKACIFGKNRQKIDVPAIMEVECNKGDVVLVEIPNKEIIAAPIFLYLIPLLLMLTGFIVGNYINLIWQIILGFGFLFLSFVVIIIVDRLYFMKKNFSPKIVKIIYTKNQEELKND